MRIIASTFVVNSVIAVVPDLGPVTDIMFHNKTKSALFVIRSRAIHFSITATTTTIFFFYFMFDRETCTFSKFSVVASKQNIQYARARAVFINKIIAFFFIVSDRYIV